MSAEQTGAITKGKYRPEIDGLRAFAVVAVIINHFNKDILPGGYLGVDIFFVISGYVITSSLYGRPSKDFKDFISGFYERRIKRLVPALSVFVLITSIAICLFNPTPGLSLRTGLTSLFGLSNLYLMKQSTDYFAQSTELNVFTHTWSLGVEEQFYILFPFLIWFSGFGRQTKNSARNLFLAVGALTIASLVGFLYLYPTNQPAAYFLMPSRFWEMAAGCLIFIGFQKRASVERLLEKVPPLLVMALIVGVMYLPMSLAAASTIAVVALSSILIASLKKRTTAFKVFTNPKVVYIGLISYSLYLWHWGVLSISRWTIGIHWWSVPFQVALMLGLAVASYRWIETPLRKGNWFGRRWKTLVVGGGLLLTGSLNILLIEKRQAQMYVGKKNSSSEFIEGHNWDYKNCALFFDASVVIPNEHSLPGSLHETFAKCWIDSAKNRTFSQKIPHAVNVFGYGNSYTQQLIPAYNRISRGRNSIRFNVVTSQCIASGILRRRSHSLRKTQACHRIFREYVDWFLRNSNSGDILIIAESMIGYSKNNVFSEPAPAIITAAPISSNRATQIRARELNDLASRLERQGKTLIYASGIPYLAINPESCGQWFSYTNNHDCDRLDPDSRSKQYLPYTSITTQLKESVGQADIFRAFEKSLVNYKGSISELYYNIDHINRTGALLIVPYLSKVLAKNN